MSRFKCIPEENRRSVTIIVRVTRDEAVKIRKAADIRCLSVSDYMRRAALGRKAEVKIETHIILALMELTQAIRDVHKSYLDRGLRPPEEILGPVLDEAVKAILYVSKL